MQKLFLTNYKFYINRNIYKFYKFCKRGNYGNFDRIAGEQVL